MRLLLVRDVFTRTTTLSTLYVMYDGDMAYTTAGWVKRDRNAPVEPLLLGYVCEDEDRGLDQLHGLAECQRLKVKKETAIPVGRYRLTRTYSERFHEKTHDGKMVLVNDVFAFQGVRWHPGNTEADTDACQLPGTKRDVSRMMVTGSTVMWQWIDKRIEECEARHELVDEIITRDPAAWAAFQAVGGADGLRTTKA